ncbi:hypothetical protein L596_005709 [Steinernema carpocapsae]|uniref:Uncharacterized protein n=1 Tax=Steinernema carpocapsae TaxID=34508 RepID=A0A4U8UZW2_STECR|nr:hypothetical protein L596_005709 [Steinernema carpocapsae]
MQDDSYSFSLFPPSAGKSFGKFEGAGDLLRKGVRNQIQRLPDRSSVYRLYTNPVHQSSSTMAPHRSHVDPIDAKQADSAYENNARKQRT